MTIMFTGIDEAGKEMDETKITSKQDFMDPAQKVDNQRVSAAEAKKKATIKQMSNPTDDGQSKIISGVNEKLSKSNAAGIKPEEDVELSNYERDTLEQIMFKGYAVYDIPVGFKNRKVTIMSQSPADLELTDIMIKKFLNSVGDDSNMTENILLYRRNVYTMAMYIVGFDGKDFSEGEHPYFRLSVIKAAYKKANKYLDEGELDKYKELMDTIVNAISYRASVIREWGTILGDAIGKAKFDFEEKLYGELNPKREKAVPKF